MTKKLKEAVILTALLFVLGSVQVLAQGSTIYNNIPGPLPGNLPSLGYEATSTAEFGDRVTFSAGSGRALTTVVQTMSSWGCESGHWYSNDCVTTPGATFSHPITLNIYNVGAGNEPGSLIGTMTQTFAIPYRPSASASCTGGRWSDGTSCFNGYAVNITFDLRSLAITLPNQVIFGIAYNTSNYGYAPIGTTTACYASSAGCGYDSLNVGLEDPAVSNNIGSNPAPDDAYFNSLFGPNYCDSGTGGIGTFRLDAGCWTGFKPSTRFNAANPPTTANQCKNGGWQTRQRPDGTPFKNQGDCIQYVNTGR
jgi:hypothetical protein